MQLRQLWKKGSGKALTMRAVARAAPTNAPAVYRRFPHRDDILRALVQETRQDWLRLVEASSSVEDACERYIARLQSRRPFVADPPSRKPCEKYSLSRNSPE